MAPLELARDRHARLESHFQRAVLVQTDEPIEDLPHAPRIIHLDEEGRRQLVGPGDEVVVHVELRADRILPDEPFRPHHLLDLGAERFAVLENERHHGPELNAAPLLQLDHRREALLADRFVRREVQEVARSELPHGAGSSSVIP